MARASGIDVYFSADVEADGPIPGPYSMVSFGLCVAGTFDGHEFREIPVDKHTFYAELRPISDSWDPEALAVSGLTREELIATGRAPSDAMNDAYRFVKQTAEHIGGRPVFAAYPLPFDWMFLYHYFVQFADEVASAPSPQRSPFGFSNAVDMKSYFAARASAPIVRSTKRFMPRHLFGSRPHSHNALEDAQEQGELLQNMLRWPGHSRSIG